MTDETVDPSGDHETDPGEVTFAGLVLSLAHTAAVHLGDAVDPVSGKPGEPNVAAARQMIDILGLLDTKTRGNLSAEERQLLEQVLYELRLRCAEVARAAGQEPSQSRIIIP